MAQSPPPPPRRTVLVLGANGAIGSACARSFTRSGWRVFGVVRRATSGVVLARDEIIPLIGTPTDHTLWLPLLFSQIDKVDTVVCASEDIPNYAAHFAGVLTTLRAVAEANKKGDKSHEQGKQLFVLFSSGCKDYGLTQLHGDVELAPHTESSPLKPPPPLRIRTEHADKILALSQGGGDSASPELFDVAVLRATTVFGLSGSYYADAFQRAEEAAAGKIKASGKKTLVIPSRPNSIAHGTHVDDVGDAYLALAEHYFRIPEDKAAVAGQCFNISGYRYETAQEIAEALKQEYGLDEIEYVPEPGTEETSWANALWAFSQWVGSDKIRRLVGWQDKRPLFSENLHTYRIAYEAFQKDGDERVERTAKLLTAVKSGKSRETVSTGDEKN